MVFELLLLKDVYNFIKNYATQEIGKILDYVNTYLKDKSYLVGEQLKTHEKYHTADALEAKYG